MDKKYSQLIADIELVEILLTSTQYRRSSFPDPENYPEFTANFSPGKVTSTCKNGILKINQEVIFALDEINEETKKTKKVFSLKAKYDLVYEIKEEPDEELLEEFQKRNIPVNLHPYARELIQSSMAKTGLPPFTLPVLKIKK